MEAGVIVRVIKVGAKSTGSNVLAWSRLLMLIWALFVFPCQLLRPLQSLLEVFR
mgnify:CR=1 FL=1